MPTRIESRVCMRQRYEVRARHMGSWPYSSASDARKEQKTIGAKAGNAMTRKATSEASNNREQSS